MTRKKIILALSSALSLTAILVSLYFFNFKKTDSQYNPLETFNNQEKVKGWEGAQEYYKKIRSNRQTGKIERSDYQNAISQIKSMNVPKATSITWQEQGPDNIGGRTRAILVDQDDPNTIYAGSISGGLWISNLGGATWNRLEDFEENLGVSSLCQTDDGTIYIGTGHQSEGTSGIGSSGYRGNGVYYTEDGGSSFQHIANTENFGDINEVRSVGNTVWMATGSGLKTYSNGNITDIQPTYIRSLNISPDGNTNVGRLYI